MCERGVLLTMKSVGNFIVSNFIATVVGLVNLWLTGTFNLLVPSHSVY